MKGEFGPITMNVGTRRAQPGRARGILTAKQLRRADTDQLNSTLADIRDEVARRLRDKHGWQGSTVGLPRLAAALDAPEDETSEQAERRCGR